MKRIYKKEKKHEYIIILVRVKHDSMIYYELLMVLFIFLESIFF